MGPVLLDTCILQHLRYLSQLIDGWDLSDDDVAVIRRRYPGVLGQELVALAELASLTHRNGAPWLVSETALLEFEKTAGSRAVPLIHWWWGWPDYMFGCFDAEWYPGVDADELMLSAGPEVHEDQLELPLIVPRLSLDSASVPPFGPFRDAGDRALIRDALRSGIARILTTDIKSFWRHRRCVAGLGIEILRPTQLWAEALPARR